MKPKSTARKKISAGKATSSKKSSDHEKRFHSAFEGMLEGAQILGFDWRYLYLNPAAESHNRRPNRELLGNRYMDMWPGIEETHVFSEIKRCLEDRIPSRLENRFVYPDGRVGWFILGIQPIPEGVLILSFDVTERVRAEQQATQMKRLYATLSQVNQTIVRIRNRQELFESICKVAVDFGEFRLAWIGLYNEESGELSPVAEYGSAGNKLPFKRINAKEMPFKEGLIGLALRSAQVEYSNDIQTDPRMQHWRETAIQGNYHSATAIPIQQGGRVVGLLNLYAADIDFFDVEEEQSLLKEMGLDISFALDMMKADEERRRAGEELNASEHRLKLFVEYAPASIAMLDRNMTYIAASRRYLMDYRIEDQQIIGRSHYEVFPEIPEHWKEIHRRCLAGVVERADEDPFPRADGSLDWVHWEIHPWYDDQKEIGGVILFSEVITERKQAEDKLQAQTERLNLATWSAGIGIWDWDIQKNRLIWDDRMYALYGIKPGDFGGAYEAWANGLHPDDRASSEEITNRTLRGEGEYDTEFRVLWPDGSIHWLKAAGQVFRDQESQPLRMVGVNYDITERKQAEEVLHVRDAQLREAQIIAGLGNYRLNFATGIWRSSDILDTIFGIDETYEHSVEGWTALIHPIDRQKMTDYFTNDVIGKHISFNKEYRIIRKNDGVERWVHGLGRLEFDADDQLSFMLGTIQDITERKRAEEDLAYQAELLANVQDAIVSTDADLHITYWNRAAEEIFGWTAAEAIGMATTELFQTQFPNSSREQVLQKLMTGGYYDGELCYARKDGEYIDVHARSVALKNAQEQFAGLVSSIRDITQRKRADDALRESEERFSTAFFTSPVAQSIIDQKNNEIMMVNDACCQLFGYNREELIGGSTAKLNLWEDPADRLAAVEEVQRTGHLLSREATIRTKSGGIRTIIVAIEPISWKGFPCFISSIFDITERKQAEELIHQYASDLEKRVEERTAELLYANRAKDEFLANMSHELRTPLNGILGLSESLFEGISGPLNEKQNQSLQTIYSSGEHLLGLINDILDVSKIEAGKFKIVGDYVSVNDLCISSLSFINQAALKKSIYVEYTRQTEGTMMFGDPKHLKQILVNLLNNAVKFTPEKGSVKLGVDINEEEGRIRFSVQDTGVGISSEDLKKLFEPFVQLDNSLSRQYQGSGLGLALVKKLVELHGGTVLVESEVGQGSNFIVTFPWSTTPERDTRKDLTKSIAAENNENARVANTGIRIFIAEDNEANIMVIEDYLEHFGYQVFVAQNGRVLLDEVQKVSPHLILMDIQMPEMNGFDAARALRSMPGFDTVPIVALTAFAMPGDRERCLEAGMNEYLSKPVNLKLLLKLVRDLV